MPLQKYILLESAVSAHTVVPYLIRPKRGSAASRNCPFTQKHCEAVAHGTLTLHELRSLGIAIMLPKVLHGLKST